MAAQNAVVIEEKDIAVTVHYKHDMKMTNFRVPFFRNIQFADADFTGNKALDMIMRCDCSSPSDIFDSSMMSAYLARAKHFSGEAKYAKIVFDDAVTFTKGSGYSSVTFPGFTLIDELQSFVDDYVDAVKFIAFTINGWYMRIS